MPAQQILPEITRATAPHLVDVIGVALHVVVLEQEVASLDAVVVRLAFLPAADPRELEALEIASVAIRVRNLGSIGRENLVQDRE